MFLSRNVVLPTWLEYTYLLILLDLAELVVFCVVNDMLCVLAYRTYTNCSEMVDRPIEGIKEQLL